MWLIALILLLDHGEAATIAGDVEALRAFQRGVQDPLSKLESWKGDDPCAAGWQGIVCAPDASKVNHITEIHLLNSNLSGTLSLEIGSLTALRVLNLMWNSLSGSIPSTIGNLVSLELLLLNGNVFTGPLPFELGNLVNLNRLQVDQNKLTGPLPSSLSNLINIKHLHMNDNAFEKIPYGLGKLPVIHILLDNNRLKGLLPNDIGNLSQLQILQLDNNPFDEQEVPGIFATSLVELIRLSMRNCSLTGSLPNFSALSKLKYLDLSQNNLYGEIPNTNWSSPTTLDLSDNSFAGDVPIKVAAIDSLELISLKNNNLDGTVNPLLNALLRRKNDLIMDLQENRLNAFLRIDNNIPSNVKLWLYGNGEVCKLKDASKFCEPQALDSFPDDVPTDSSNINNCPKDICNPDIDELVPGLAADGNCKCASPIRVVVRLKSPGFRFFAPHIRLYESYMSSGLKVAHLAVTSHYWDKQRLDVKLSIFPSMKDGNRRFNQSEVKRIFLAFTQWTIPDNVFFGPRDLVSFVPPYGIDIFTGGRSSSTDSIFATAVPVFLGVSFGVAAFVAAALIFFLRRGNVKKKDEPWKNTRQLSFKVEGVTSFSWEEMERATDSFHESRKIGQGGYGKVYRGVLDDGTLVAIKRAEEASRNGATEFHNEIQLLSRLHHRNLVSLIGYYLDDNEQMLVYEFMSGGTLREHLSPTFPVPLNLRSRLIIALGAAKGILYLHTEANPPIFHRDIKSTNILLDEKNNPKVADFGLSKLAPAADTDGISGHVSTVVRGTPGYLDPEYFLTHKLTDKSDVYSFGVVLLELLTGMQPIYYGKNIVREVRSAFERGMILNIVDSRMGPLASELLERFVRLALSCSSDEPQARPAMSDVVRDLEALRLAASRPDALQSLVDNEPGTSSRRLDSGSVLADQFVDNDDSQSIGMVLPR